MMNPVSVKNISVSFGRQIVLDDLSFELTTGEIVGLIGPSGAGKSTFVNSLMGMQRVQSGEICLFDVPMPNCKIMAQVGFTAQTDALFEELTGKQNLEFFSSLQGLSHKEFLANLPKVAETVNLTADLNKKLSNYSGGMKRRLSLAIALQTNAPLLLLDEPTVGIDPELRAEIWTELRKLATSGKSILITTHVMDEAERCDKVLLLREGHFVAQGTPDEIKAQYQVATIEEAFIKAGQELAKEAAR